MTTRTRTITPSRYAAFFLVAMLCLATAFSVLAAIQGQFKTTLSWSKYTDANALGLKIYVGNAPGVYTTNYLVPRDSTNLVLDVQPGKTYYAAMVAYAGSMGVSTAPVIYESVPSAEVTWNTPADLATPEGFTQKVTIYIK